MSFTKPVDAVNVSEEVYANFVENNIVNFKEFEEYLLKIENDIKFKLFDKNSKLKNEFDTLLKQDYIYIKNKDVYYWNKFNAISPNFNSIDEFGHCSSGKFDSNSLRLNFKGYNGRIINCEEVEYFWKFLLKNKNFKLKPRRLTFCDANKNYKWYEDGVVCDFLSCYSIESYHIPLYDLKIYPKNRKIYNFLEENLIPEGLSIDAEKKYLEILELYKQKIILLKNNLKIDLDLLKKLFLNGFEYKYQDEDLNIDNLKNKLLNQKNITVNFDLIKSTYLNCEKDRADIEAYDQKILQDPNRGHWDLWDDNFDENKPKFKLETEVMARNPIADIKEDGIIGIDFGTKSTVVVFMEGREYIMPMRIGTGNYKSEINSNQYENPTVMQFIDLDKFLNNYNEKNGRPNTKWKDLAISHIAYDNLIEGSSSDKYYTFLSDLKQWAGSSKKNIRIRDEKSFDEILKPYIELSEDDFDPIEIYAYYLGLYINNMRNGIYLKYVLSFPVTYEKAIREKIIHSFEKGIKKSLPETILNDEEVMKKFKVSFGASEPAAYSISALTEYDIEPQDNPVFYGVFDFGGGTTDFDFGIYKESEGRDRRRFDYIIEHFGAGGDRTLGGENLLELLAFEIFKKNQKVLKENGITFTLPVDCVRFKGSEILISDSQEAKLNTKRLMEKVRPIWENNKDVDDFENKIQQLESGTIELDHIYDKSGNPVTRIDLIVDIEELKQILTDRIEKGIINFFDALKLSFNFSGDEKIKEINIFLAGNSSKSKIVKDLFNEYIEKESKEILEGLGISDKENVSLFKLYPPLGTDEALNIQEKLGIDINSDIERPNCKTGVAFGLLKSRDGGRIKVVDKNLSDNEISFKYYLGYPIKGKFFVEIDRNNEYNKWFKFIDAYYDTFELYYTSLPEAMSGNIKIEDVKRKMYNIDVTSEDEDVNVYIRFADPSTIEYVVAKDDEIEKGVYLSDIVRGELD